MTLTTSGDAMSWQVQEAKQRFSEVIRAAQSGEPQVVTKHGEAIVVIVDIGEFHRMRGESATLMDYLRVGPHVDDFAVERPVDEHRDIDLTD